MSRPHLALAADNQQVSAVSQRAALDGYEGRGRFGRLHGRHCERPGPRLGTPETVLDALVDEVHFLRRRQKLLGRQEPCRRKPSNDRQEGSCRLSTPRESIKPVRDCPQEYEGQANSEMKHPSKDSAHGAAFTVPQECRLSARALCWYSKMLRGNILAPDREYSHLMSGQSAAHILKAL